MDDISVFQSEVDLAFELLERGLDLSVSLE
jgi:hypothetical protein